MHDGHDKTLSATLRSFRTAAGMTQETLAERAGVSARTVSDVERGLRTHVYVHTARRLATALGLKPEEEQRFYAIARGGTEPSLAWRSSSMPEIPTTLIGRSEELGATGTLLMERSTRLLTLTGPGGIGKTRLALEVAKRVGQSFAGGVYFVSLGDVRDASLVASEIAKTLGVVATGESLALVVRERLAHQRGLLVLDTFEHLIAAAPLVYGLLIGCAELTILVTSRTALRLRGEREFEVPPLALPWGAVAAAEDLAASPATSLFVDRARAVKPDLVVDASGAALVAEICQKLDGLPLAIELAAARVKHLPLAAIRGQLDDRLRLLVGGPLDLPRRQRAIRDTVAWSHDLLSQAEGTLFGRLSVFSGGWDLRAAEAVAGPISEVGDALEGISALVDQSLVALDPKHSEARYDMLEVVREYAAERLRLSGEGDAVRRRHALHYLELAEHAQPNLVRVGHEHWFARLDLERGNLRRALAWTIGHRETVVALRFSVALWQYWRRLGEFPEGRRWSEAALAIPGEAPPSLRAKAVAAAAGLAFPQGDYVRMAQLASQATELAAAGDDPIDRRNALTLHGMVAMGEGRHDEAVASFAEALAVCRPLGVTWQLATSHLNLGLALLHVGEAERADAAFQDALQVYRTLGDDVFAARTVNHRAHAALMQGDVDAAEELARDSVVAFAEQDERQGIADAMATLAAIAASRSDAERAATLQGAVAAIRDIIQARPAPFEAVIAARFVEPLERAADHWETASAAGRRMSRVAAVEYAASRATDEPGRPRQSIASRDSDAGG